MPIISVYICIYFLCISASEYRCDNGDPPSQLCGWGYGAQPAFVQCADVKIVPKAVTLPLANFVAPDYQALYASLDGTTELPILSTAKLSTEATTLFPPIVTGVPTDNITQNGSTTTETPPDEGDKLVIGPVLPVVPIVGGALGGGTALVAGPAAAGTLAGGAGAAALGTNAAAAGLLGGAGSFGGLLFPGLMVLGAMTGMSGMFGGRSSRPSPLVLPPNDFNPPFAAGPYWFGGNFFPSGVYGRPIFIPDERPSISVSERVSVNYRRPYSGYRQYNSYRNYNG